MSLSNAEKQRRYKQRMYEAGFKQFQVWIKRDEPKEVKTDLEAFVRKMKKLTTGWSEEELPTLLHLLLKITEGKKEAILLKE